MKLQITAMQMNDTNKKVSFLKIQDLNVTLTSSYNSTRMKTTKRRQRWTTTTTQNMHGTTRRRQHCQNLFTETNINAKKDGNSNPKASCIPRSAFFFCSSAVTSEKLRRLLLMSMKQLQTQMLIFFCQKNICNYFSLHFFIISFQSKNGAVVIYARA